MSTSSALADSPKEAKYEHGEIVVRTMGGAEIQFNPSLNPRLAKGAPQHLANIELSPFGLHWPDLDEDLSLRGIRDGNFGQLQQR